MYSNVSPNFDFTEREKEILDFWHKNRIFEKSISAREGAPVYTFYDGPPTANGTPHIGHVETRAIKDLIPRYRTMKGCKVLRKAGWDTHGLPVELEVERQLGLDGKEQIERYGVAPFIEKCKESVWKYKAMWEEFSDAVGFWADMDNPYVTYHNNYIESVWWSLKKIFEENLLFKGHKTVPYCPRCGTPLSSHEVAQGYRDVTEKSAIVKFKVKHQDAYFLAWTTTPWTLPSNVALCVNPLESYVKVSSRKEIYYLAEARCEAILGESYEVLERLRGSDLEFVEYEPLFHFGAPNGKAYFVTTGDFVTLSDGTGIVHIAPAFGEDDYNVGKRYDLAFVQYVNARGEMTDNTPWAGTFVKKADPLVLADLEDRELLFSDPIFEHSYPHCWRCGTPLIYYARESWYIRISGLRDRLLQNNSLIHWFPESIGQKRFGDWLENAQDWAISRNRYWGTPLPVWICAQDHMHVIGSIAELKELSDNCPDDIELHRPYIDAVTFRCPTCGGVMKRTEEVIDCWYDSGAMPFAQWHFPFENEAVFTENYPADFISEAVDQTRGWFYSLLAISTLIFDSPCYKNVLVLGHVLDKDGQKMSKSKGNAVDPIEALKKHGADAVRWYFYANSSLWLPKRFHDDAIVEGQRKFLGTLWNVYAFYVLYAEIDQFDPSQHCLEPDKLSVMDQWLLSRLHTVIQDTDTCLGQYRITEAARIAEDFVDVLSNWYVRRSRDRFWGKDMPQDKINAYMTLYTTLVTISKLWAPMIPFITESIYQNLVCGLDANSPESVHLCDYPAANEQLIHTELEQCMDVVLKIVTLGRAARNEAGIKNRQPLSLLYVSAPADLPSLYSTIIAEELNVKRIEYRKDLSAFTTFIFKPQLKTVGPKYGKQLNEIRTSLAALDGNSAKDELEQNGMLTLDLPGGNVALSAEDLLIESARLEHYVMQSDGGYAAALDTRLDDELIEEGFVRELISKLQTMRRESGFYVTDMIQVTAEGNSRIAEILSRNADTVRHDVLASAIAFCEAPQDAFIKQWDINGETVTLSVKRL